MYISCNGGIRVVFPHNPPWQDPYITCNGGICMVLPHHSNHIGHSCIWGNTPVRFIGSQAMGAKSPHFLKIETWHESSFYVGSFIYLVTSKSFTIFQRWSFGTAQLFWVLSPSPISSAYSASKRWMGTTFVRYRRQFIYLGMSLLSMCLYGKYFYSLKKHLCTNNASVTYTYIHSSPKCSDGRIGSCTYLPIKVYLHETWFSWWRTMLYNSNRHWS
jgi:hypothetical protein